MKYVISHPLTEAKAFKEPLLAPDVTWDQYLAILRAEAVKHNQKFELAVDLLTKWVQEDFDLSIPAAINEEYLNALRIGLKDGKKVGLKGDPLAKVTVQKIFTNIRLLHNQIQADQKAQKFLRPLVDGRLVNRFIFFNTLTEQTQKAMVTFQLSATRPPYDKQLMTGQTREGAIEDALLILRRLGIKGLEQITAEHITALTANPDANNPEYRRTSSSLHHAACLFRFCVRKGLLSDNPLTKIDNSSFANHAIRDFLPPDQLEILLDIHGKKGTVAVDLNDELSVRDWLVVLLLVDLALRRSELAGLSWDNIQYNRDDNGYQIRLDPENQKMATKTGVILPILYPQTQELLKRYAQMRGVRIGQHSNMPLILDKRQHPASSGTIARIVNQLATKLGLRTYHQVVPSCHDLRRTFATCNAKPLGLGLDLQELSERLRAGINVVHQHYILQNPLLQEAKTKKYRDKLRPKDADESILEKIRELEPLAKKDRSILQLLRDRVTQRIQAKTESIALKHTPDWVSEEDGMLILRQRWNHLPIKRAFREFMQAKQAVKHVGKHWTVQYDAVFLKGLVEQYEPIADHIDLQDRLLQPLLRGYQLESIGYLKLIKQTELVALLKTIRNQDRKLASVKTSKGYLSKLAKVKIEETVSKQQYAAIA